MKVVSNNKLDRLHDDIRKKLQEEYPDSLQPVNHINYHKHSRIAVKIAIVLMVIIVVLTRMHPQVSLFGGGIRGIAIGAVILVSMIAVHELMHILPVIHKHKNCYVSVGRRYISEYHDIWLSKKMYLVCALFPLFSIPVFVLVMCFFGLSPWIALWLIGMNTVGSSVDIYHFFNALINVPNGSFIRAGLYRSGRP